MNCNTYIHITYILIKYVNELWLVDINPILISNFFVSRRIMLLYVYYTYKEHVLLM